MNRKLSIFLVAFISVSLPSLNIFAEGSAVFQPPFIVASEPTVFSVLSGNVVGVTFTVTVAAPSLSTGQMPAPSCAQSSPVQWQVTSELSGDQSFMKVTVHLTRSLQLCDANSSQTDCCLQPLCVVESVQVTACLGGAVVAVLLVQAEIFALSSSNMVISGNATVIPNQVYQPLGSCPCNLTAGACDIRCCCDQDCNSNLKLLFSAYCYAGVFGGNVTPLFDQLCSAQNASTAPDWFPFLCVQSSLDNSPFLGLFYQGAVVNITQTPSFRVSLLPGPVMPNGYKQGDPVITAGSQYFTIPQQSVNGPCLTNAPVAYLQNFNATCRLLFVSCDANPSLCIQTSSLNLILANGQGGTVTITPTERLVTDLTGFVSNPSSVTLLNPAQQPVPSVASLSCKNVSLSMDYTFFWSGTYLENVTVVHSLATVCVNLTAPSPIWLTRMFSAAFLRGNPVALPKSGNPGYQIGKPVIAGNLQSGTGKINRTTLNLWEPVGNGLCSNAKTTAVLFRQDSITGCLLQLSQQNFTNCTYLRDSVQNTLSALVPATLVAKMGNSDSTNLSQWLHITSLPSNVTLAPADDLPGSCSAVPSQLNIHIFIADTGAVEGAIQQEIINVETGFTPVLWQLQCGGASIATCLNDTIVQTFPVSISVTFIKIDTTALFPKTRFQLNYTAYDCERNNVCWPQLAYPLTRFYTGESYSMSLAKGMILTFFFIAAAVLGSPWSKIRQAWNNSTF
ncbi:tectonic-2 [Polypterus senegalus]|uniref:tectonic-2 n=1 Tax=Polypterus senegalus TaxID=55291 RepID=UPI001966B06D|nr:tectonic-2 [Polypterus senegalus]